MAILLVPGWLCGGRCYCTAAAARPPIGIRLTPSPLPKDPPLGEVSDGAAREYRASLVVDAAAASAATTTAITAVLIVQLRKLRPIKVVVG